MRWWWREHHAGLCRPCMHWAAGVGGWSCAAAAIDLRRRGSVFAWRMRGRAGVAVGAVRGGRGVAWGARPLPRRHALLVPPDGVLRRVVSAGVRLLLSYVAACGRGRRGRGRWRGWGAGFRRRWAAGWLPVATCGWLWLPVVLWRLVRPPPAPHHHLGPPPPPLSPPLLSARRGRWAVRCVGAAFRKTCLGSPWRPWRLAC